jgi:transcriptional regulator with XRE-family HTH domain
MTGKILKELRIKNEYNQSDFAELLGTYQQRISQWENEIKSIPLYIEKLIGEYLKNKKLINL